MGNKKIGYIDAIEVVTYADPPPTQIITARNTKALSPLQDAMEQITANKK